MKANPIFIGEGEGKKSLCDVCKVYRQYFKDQLLCPMCGSKEAVTALDKQKGEYLQNEYVSEPMVGIHKKKENKDDEDLPPGAHWVD